MKHRWLSIIGALFLTVMITIPVLAATASPATIETPTDVFEGIGYGGNQNTFYANGRHWEIYLNVDDDLVYRSSINGVTWAAEVEIVANTALSGPEFSCWYDAADDRVHYVRHDLDTDNTVYRMGTPAANGTITWAAVEQIVGATPGNLLTFRVDICTDIDGYPWVAWVDDDGVDTDRGIVYIESSSTKNGTWTEDTTATIEPVGYKVWFVNIIPVQEAPYARVEVHYSMEDIDGEGLGDVALMAADDLDDFVEQLAIASAGNMNATRPDAFASINNSAAVTVVYARADGDVMTRTHSAITTWATADAASEILTASAVSVYLPSLSAYTTPLGHSFMCIVNDNLFMKYATNEYGGGVWSAFTTLWQVPDPDNDVISRHNASYLHNGGITGLSWQVSFDDGSPAEYDTVYYWWYDTAGGFGYYPTGTGGNLLNVLLPLVVAIGVILTGLRMAAGGSGMTGYMVAVIFGVASYIVVSALMVLV